MDTSNKKIFYCWNGIGQILYVILFSLFVDLCFYLFLHPWNWAGNSALILFIIAYFFAVIPLIVILQFAVLYTRIILYHNKLILKKLFTDIVIEMNEIQFYVRENNGNNIDGVILKDGKRIALSSIGYHKTRRTEIENEIIKTMPAPIYKYKPKAYWSINWYKATLSEFQKE